MRSTTDQERMTFSPPQKNLKSSGKYVTRIIHIILNNPEIKSYASYDELPKGRTLLGVL